MLTLEIDGGVECWDEKTEEFLYSKSMTLTLEHSLYTISKWEEKWLKPFFDEKPKTNEEALDYIRIMSVGQTDPDVYKCLNESHIKAINDYISSPATATTISQKQKTQPTRKEKLTSELIYYAMIAYEIPVEFEHWHINRLMTLIKVCDIKNNPQKKMKGRELAKYNHGLNAERLKRGKH